MYIYSFTSELILYVALVLHLKSLKKLFTNHSNYRTTYDIKNLYRFAAIVRLASVALAAFMQSLCGPLSV